MNNKVELAKQIAREAHGEQKYGDKSYIFHLERVASKRNPTIEISLTDNGDVQIIDELQMNCITLDAGMINDLCDFAHFNIEHKIEHPLEKLLFSNKLSGVDFKILYYLYKNATNKQIKCFKSDIAKNVNCGERTVFRSIDALINGGLIAENKGTYTVLI